ncbi:HEAT repeat domain-containing protein [Echinicola strongylocentroti]|uniref:HEAT repeat domain-containing protein n=1 Tax=Echinicola strongylocentroti TaxID=1795355 RepID=A0A2Z4IDP5_9BACT|nr:HEAT repeat domain-containing protein [Echinicola strongylocentroti]AWW28746.1 HEAT repeat domain-containing protein [Echinicola strongylocentroti]
MADNIDLLIQKMCDKQEDEAFIYADKLAEIGGEEVLYKLIEVLKGEDYESAYLAARGLSAMEQNEAALDPLLEVIHDKSNKMRNGNFVQALEGFDLSGSFVDILRIYLFGNFKSSTLAKEYLDYTEFDITPRVIRKAEKHWHHFQNNSANDQAFEIKKQEVEDIMTDLKGMFEEE